MKKSNYIKPDSEDDVNMVSEPAMVYGYVNQTHYEPSLIERVEEITPRPQKILQPDDDLRNAITIDELRESAHEHIRKLFAKK
jgi:hypothetical protein